MPSSAKPKNVDAATAEGIAPRGGQGTKPRKRIGLKSILERIDELEYIVQERGADEGFDPGFEAKRGALLGLLTYYEALRSDDPAMGLAKKADLVPRMVPFLNYLKELAPKGESKFPNTEKMVDSEMASRMAVLSKLVKGGAAVDKVLETMAPAAKVPPEEA